LILYEPRRGRDRILSVSQPKATKNGNFQNLPKPTGKPPYHLSLNKILSPDRIKLIIDSGEISFHTVGDTGGFENATNRHIVETAMESEFDDSDSSSNPAFFYHLGDVVCKSGRRSDEYYSQFYEPYAHYPAPIFAIPGNRDGHVPHSSNEVSLSSFVDNFCAKSTDVTPDAYDINRSAMIQPNVYWTLEAPFVTMIGLYSNVPDSGYFNNEQVDWFKKELTTAPQDKALIVCVHHSPFSADCRHSGSVNTLTMLDNAFMCSKRLPDIVLSGHVHNYQRFTRRLDDRQIPYIVAGNGGHWRLDYMQSHFNHKIKFPLKLPDRTDISLENYIDDRHGYMRFYVSPQKLIGKAFLVSRTHEAWRKNAREIDNFELDLQSHKLEGRNGKKYR
jgi:acid phosphatase type 7